MARRITLDPVSNLVPAKANRLSTKQRLAIQLRVDNPAMTWTKIAESCGVRLETVIDWKKQAHFAACLNVAVEEAVADPRQQARLIMARLQTPFAAVYAEIAGLGTERDQRENGALTPERLRRLGLKRSAALDVFRVSGLLNERPIVQVTQNNQQTTNVLAVSQRLEALPPSERNEQVWRYYELALGSGDTEYIDGEITDAQPESAGVRYGASDGRS